jgi:type I restriction enzyme M protein
MSTQPAQDFTKQTKDLIDGLKNVCANYGLGNDGNEFKIITQVFLYKFMNDKFGYEVKQLEPKLKAAESWETEIANYTDEQYEFLLLRMPPENAKLKREHFLSNLFSNLNKEEFAKFFDDTLRDIAIFNNEIFAVKTGTGAKVTLFDRLSDYITDASQRDNFCRALVNQLVNFSFEKTFGQKFDFFSTIFEYLIKDYNKDGGGKYAEYYTPHAVRIVTGDITHGRVNQDRCHNLRLNLILNNLVHSIQNVIQGDTLRAPYHRTGDKLATFDYIVSNPPFKLDFSDWRDDLDTKQNRERFFAGIPNIPNKDKDKMAIYLLFVQHIIFSLSAKGRAAVVVPTGFLTAQKGIGKKIREKLVDERMLRGVVSMPSNIFATTGTNVSILFIDKSNKKGDIVLMDSSKLGETIKDGKNQKTLLSHEDEQKIIATFNGHEAQEDFTVVVSYEQIKAKNYSFSAGQYFELKIEYTHIMPEEFAAKINHYNKSLALLFSQSRDLEIEVHERLAELNYERES